jgi:hypothetical protein
MLEPLPATFEDGGAAVTNPYMAFGLLHGISPILALTLLFATGPGTFD